jgi:hypothetical protein
LLPFESVRKTDPRSPLELAAERTREWSDKVTWPPEGLGDGKISTTSPTAGALPTSAATWRQAGRARGLVADERAHVGERGPPALVTVADEVTG